MVPEYNMSLQTWIPVTLAAVHNFIQEHEPEEEENDNDPNDLQPIGGGVDDDDDEVAEINDGLGQHDDRRDQIAKDMWAQYADEHLHHGIPLPDIKNQYNKYIFHTRHYNMTEGNTNNMTDTETLNTIVCVLHNLIVILI